MSQHSHARGRPPRPATRIASYLLTDYLERLGVEVGLRAVRPHGHRACSTRSARAASGSSRTRHEQIAAHAADGYARATGKPGVVLSHLGPGLTNAATGVANAALDSIPMVVIAGDMQSYYYGRHPHQEVQPPPGRRPVADLPAVLQARLSRRSRRGSAADHRARVSSGADRPARAGARRRADGHLLGRSAGRRVSAGRPPPIARPTIDPATAARIVDGAGRRRAAGALRRRRRAVGARDRRAGGARRGARGAGRPHADGQGLPARGPSAAARPDRLLGHADRQRHVPHAPT